VQPENSAPEIGASNLGEESPIIMLWITGHDHFAAFGLTGGVLRG